MQEKYRKKYKEAETPLKCEYADIMGKSFFNLPERNETSCNGFRNKYNSVLSDVCVKCRFVRKDDENGSCCS